MNNIYIHVLSTGAIWASSDQTFVPTGTVLATYQINSLTHNQLLGTVSGNAGSYAASGHTGRYGKEIN